MSEVCDLINACACCGGKLDQPAGRYELMLRSGEVDGRSTFGYPLLACEKCGHVAASPPPSQRELDEYYGKEFWVGHTATYDVEVIGWQEKLISTSSLWERFRRACTQLEFIRATGSLVDNPRIIDLGAGYSPFLFHCSQAGFQDLHALEPAADICAFLKTVGVKAYPSMLEDFIEDDETGTFDMMTLSHTLEHLRDPHSVLRGLARKLNPGGCIFIDVPYQDHLNPYHEGLHLHFFNSQSVQFLVDRSDLQVIYTEVDRHSVIDKVLLKILYSIYGQFMHGKGGAKGSKIEILHRIGWRPLKAILQLKLNIFISSRDLRVVARRTG